MFGTSKNSGVNSIINILRNTCEELQIKVPSKEGLKMKKLKKPGDGTAGPISKGFVLIINT